jgi:C1A family cysteine protease
VDFVRNKQGLAPWAPSPLFTYYCTRKMEKTIKWDSGASVRDALKSTVNYGVVKESDWKYKPAKFAKKPPMLVFNGAKMNQTIQYHRILDGVITDMKACLAEGYPFIFGFEVYDTFESDVANTTGVIPMPNKSTDQLLGGHCMMVVGWKLIDGVEYFIAQNSWSDTWGDAGYCYLPVAYFADTSLTSDLWTIRLIE